MACITCNTEGHGSDKNWRERKVVEMHTGKKTFEILQMIVNRGDVEHGRWHLLLPIAMCKYFMMLLHRELQTIYKEEMLG